MKYNVTYKISKICKCVRTKYYTMCKLKKRVYDVN